MPEDTDAILGRVRASRGFLWPEGVDHLRDACRRSWRISARTLLPRARRILRGGHPYFSKYWHDFDGSPDWHVNPRSGGRVPQDEHWSDLGWGSSGYGDLKIVLEPSRFTWVFTLVRAYLLTGEEKYAEGFWQRWEDWISSNPPQAGPLWICGQEVAYRVMAWSFALYGLAHSSASTDQRMVRLVASLGASADRILGSLFYARSQRNNHALAEGAALWTVGLLFPEFGSADRWEDMGKRVLEEETIDQFSEKGEYVQDSLNYQRVALQDLTWSHRLGQVHGRPLSDQAVERVKSSVFLLQELTDRDTGRVPNYGDNDGTLVLPLSECDFEDFRPEVVAAANVFGTPAAFEPGPWDETLFWLLGDGTDADDRASQFSIERSPLRDPQCGFHTFVGESSWCFVRCGEYDHRPSHADELHMDLWWKGVNVASDPGSYLYNGEPPWRNGLRGTAVHNTVTVDGQDQMRRCGKFLWLDWPSGRTQWHVEGHEGRLEYWEGEQDGYLQSHGVRHRRAVLKAGADRWIVLDRIGGSGNHLIELHWLLPDVPYESVRDGQNVILNTEKGCYGLLASSSADGQVYLICGGKVERGAAQSSLSSLSEVDLRGWRSSSYSVRESALSFVLQIENESLPVIFVTWFGPTAAGLPSLSVEPSEVRVSGTEGNMTIDLDTSGEGLIASQVRAEDATGPHALDVSRGIDLAKPKNQK